ncbi:MAG: LacI family DNA-binding transcriptional regulator [Roseburia intestinalis]
MVTIKDIARESGYSVSTVSRVLNHRNDVSPDAKKKIEKVVAKFNFVPNNNAKHLKQNNSKAIGVLVKGISKYAFCQCRGGNPAYDREIRNIRWSCLIWTRMQMR